ncbi:thiamine pyrophosphate-dependent acetolactate synthase large subunit-like protein [Caldalkalibacillus uzonensis]|uniref:Thiamine pyrophosphate-dependent acetolactate synthase large subunit-like protein n=1 Tax=Caldalkalibacillus uzonensis TaxID=353224 RepID=A0ABU0CX72_9BACI|nr:thiamine pyrophosphate-dependent enzyme [Caldalkalibacillus uzonensis]MDQ0340818.1 thiamine pyrophosphate-dependent acetolactate synthase large subunit-like protein [Caldalkalibacillus uzonensis]
MDRIDALRIVYEYAHDFPVISTCGATSREWASLGKKPNHLYVVDSMGLSPSIALGVSLAIEDKPIDKCIVLEGDGGILMNPNVLASAAYLEPEKWLCIVLDNECFASTGGQRSLAAKINISSVASGYGVKTLTAENTEQFRQALIEALKVKEPVVIHAKIGSHNEKVDFINDNPAVMAAEFTKYIVNKCEGV